MAYRNECYFIKTTDDDGNAVNAPDIVTDTDNSARLSQTPSSQSWTAADQSSTLPTRERGSGSSQYVTIPGLMPNARGGFETDGSSPNAMSGTSQDGPSNRPTPNSGSTGGGDNRHNLVPGGSNGMRNSRSYEASPAAASSSSHLRQTNKPTHQSEGEAAAAAFFGDMQNGTGGFDLGPDVSTGLTPRFTLGDTPGDVYNVPPVWDIPGGTGMTPVSDGVLRTIMSMDPMDPMDTMDMGWDTSTHVISR